PPSMDSPPETNLFDLLPPEEPRRELASLTFEVVDNQGEGLTVQYQVRAPSGDPAGALPAGERRMVGDLEPNADVEVELSGIVLPLHDDEGDADGDDGPGDSFVPTPVGPDATEPDTPHRQVPLGPDGVEPGVERFTVYRTAPTPFEVSGALALPDDAPEHRHFIPVVLSALAAANNQGSAEPKTVWVVVLGPPKVAASQLASVESVVRGRRDAWVALATEDGSLEEIRAYFAHLSTHRGWPIPVEGSPDIQVRAFQGEYNTRFDATIFEDGVCGEQTLGAVFDVVRDELHRWLPAFDLAAGDLTGELVRFVAADPSGVRRPPASGLEAWVFDEAQLPSAPDLVLLYDDPRADVVPIHVPWSFEVDELVVRLRAESAEDLDGYVGVRLERCDGSWEAEVPVVPGKVEQNLVFNEVPTDGRFTVSLVRQDGTREVLVADRPFTAFLDDRESLG
ncbi:MAG: hypothetical protein KUG77_27880, partial [Nannocystaceae bacterium]|nr:hypothetical protein [Nannocystaceae bacterium]